VNFVLLYWACDFSWQRESNMQLFVRTPLILCGDLSTVDMRRLSNWTPNVSTLVRRRLSFHDRVLVGAGEANEEEKEDQGPTECELPEEHRQAEHDTTAMTWWQ
jgi:hypothetical protein